MIIQTLSNLFDEGYVEKKADSFTSPFFSGANVAFRRDVFRDIGVYDVNCATGEDQDICVRITTSKWELYFQPKAAVGHKCRKNIKAFIKQWYRYGLHHPYIFKKYNPGCLVIYRKIKGVTNGNLYKRSIYKKRFPVYVVIFLSQFLIVNIFLLLIILGGLLGLTIFALVCALITLGTAIYYFKPDIRIRHPWQTITSIFLRYAANLALLVGGFKGGARLKMMYISPTLDYKTRDFK